jgi:hypothetical protein
MRRNVWIFIGLGLVVSAILAGAVSYYASSSPDGLEKVAGDIGFGETAKDSATSDSPLSDYGVEGVTDERVAVGLAGVIGVVVTAGLAFGLFLWLGRRNAARRDEPVESGVGP